MWPWLLPVGNKGRCVIFIYFFFFKESSKLPLVVVKSLFPENTLELKCCCGHYSLSYVHSVCTRLE